MKQDALIDDHEAIYAYAYEFYSHGHYEEAKSLFSLLVVKETTNVHYWLGFGACWQMLKNYDKAIEAYAAAALLDVKEQNPFPHFYAAECFIAANNVTSALQALESASTIASKDKKYEQFIIQINLIKNAWS